MKRIQLIEWGIVTIGLIFGYKFFTSVFTAVVQLFFRFQGGENNFEKILLNTILLTAIYAVSFVILIRKSRQIAVYISGMSANESVPIKIGKHSLLQIVLISICLAAILSDIPQVLIYLFEAFKGETGRNDIPVYEYNKVTGFAFKVAAIQTIAASVVLYFSKDISGWFIRKNEADELIFESEPENEK